VFTKFFFMKTKFLFTSFLASLFVIFSSFAISPTVSVETRIANKTKELLQTFRKTFVGKTKEEVNFIVSSYVKANNKEIFLKKSIVNYSVVTSQIEELRFLMKDLSKGEKFQKMSKSEKMAYLDKTLNLLLPECQMNYAYGLAGCANYAQQFINEGFYDIAQQQYQSCMLECLMVRAICEAGL